MYKRVKQDKAWCVRALEKVSIVSIQFNNTYDKLPSAFYERSEPAFFSNPKLILFNHDLASELGIGNLSNLGNDELASIFSGGQKLSGASHIAMAYAAHQFGHFVPKLGDGRALLLGEVNGSDIQLKGAGQTPFSRRGDGRSSLGPVLREYLISEAMNALGVPTTRALAAVTTGETVYRFGEEPGGIFTRVAPSHIRVGTFQYFAARHDLDSLFILLDYAIKRHYSDLSQIEDNSEKVLRFLEEVGKRQAVLVAKWMSLGFIHGVMNTDNFTVGGFTIDYGPCAFMDEYQEFKVFSSIDQQGRYSYRNQIPIAQWNILRLADCLWPFVSEDQKVAIDTIEKRLNPIMDLFIPKRWEHMGLKFGFHQVDSNKIVLMERFLSHLEKNKLDFTLSFSHLNDSLDTDSNYFEEDKEIKDWLNTWRLHTPSLELMKRHNPIYIPRNHLVEKAIEKSYEGDYSLFYELNEAWKRPYEKNRQDVILSSAPKPEERVKQTFCGT